MEQNILKIEFSNFSVFVKKCKSHYTNLQKMWKFKNQHFLFLIISPMIFELQRHTIPHFEALDYLFWLLAWRLTLGVILSDLWTKKAVANFRHQSLCHCSQEHITNPQKMCRESNQGYFLTFGYIWNMLTSTRNFKK